MTREETLAFKGIAILMMLFLHLFNNLENVSLCQTSLYVFDKPFLFLLTRITKPVPMFLIMGGYGLFSVWGGDKNKFLRIIKLFALYWLILISFLLLGNYMNPGLYPGSYSELLLNFSSLETSYNRECWFLFPYALLSISSSWLFAFVKRVEWYYIIGVTFLLSVLVSSIFVFSGDLVNDKWYFVQPLEYISFLFPFFIGAILAREKVFERISCLKNSRFWWLTIVVIMVIRLCFIGNNLLDIIYCTALIISLNMAPFLSPMNIFLQKIGRESTGMWLIHTWICYYLFHDQLYSLQFPLVIYIFLVAISYWLSKVFSSIVRILFSIQK